MPSPYIPTNETISSPASRVYDKNYILDKKQTVYIGEPIIKVKDYYVYKSYEPKLSPSADFAVTDGITATFKQGLTYDSVGTITYNSTKYTIVPSTVAFMGATLGILVDADGAILNKTARLMDGEAYIPDSTSAEIVPQNVKMVREYKERVATDKGFTNHELIFSGIDKDTLTMTYREFTPDDIARPAFFQTLTYRSDSNSIRYKQYKIAIYDVSGESITYAVTEEPSQ